MNSSENKHPQNMNRKKLALTAALGGMLAASSLLAANDPASPGSSTDQQPAGKHGCNAKDKSSCSGKAGSDAKDKAAGQDKASCSGKSGCNAKDKPAEKDKASCSAKAGCNSKDAPKG
jgi:hypothetical protein